ncbi:1-(5-phosphoribosyl)-5-[(5-phosphoribosylamino)methylideneamino]imidazole-4-carboxamide isomerase [Buchnera aphidicola (Muscaphis stroyani)]|uniref:1-(5-phosphoribosyl)-5-[(5-phosphoribosylamino)methylideneamino] imidazole-4-carboxamide isomerase n=1 Tax=Buchnera aphidicola (Muscaphis stroyani) TaxID=1241869 RepID=A0A4D6YED8_9GAMM|nr:1-(5-phosphoribosyl)-5-[(5-phosphoribosylamino)methylideneamino]imidazole-4-carboxamide isomerase [Buchnera aphidicola]QCI24208.1 1-(5-phosphoribosyl)-5-[(5-phosphoribosylamino)methylideneamino]imidazole-4-carboxamide isomerase [Buchnera aphidicola (Muscaphis stroyani)]
MIIPSFDLINGQLVRLYQGNYSKKKYYSMNLYDCLKDYKFNEVKYVHLVDLDGAQNRKKRQIKLFKKILSYSPISIQIGGGIQTEEDINDFLEAGAKRVVIGSAAVKNKKEVARWLKNYGPDSIILALDIYINDKNEKKILINGWQQKTSVSLEEMIKYFLSNGLKHVLCTDISKDGTLSGPNINLYSEITNTFKNIKFQASGGVGSLNDIINLKLSGVESVIIGRSLLEKKFTIQEALKCWQKE